MSYRQCVLALAAILCMAPTCLAQRQSEAIELTVYNQGMGLVKDLRTLDLREGVQELRFEDVAALIDPTSVHFRAVANPDQVSVLEQNFQFDLVSRQVLLEKYLGRPIIVERRGRSGDVVASDQVTLLAADASGPSVVGRDGTLVLGPPGTTRLPALPEGLLTKPALVWQLWSEVAGARPCEISYITDGLTWEADYVAVLNHDDTALDLEGWVTLTNTSGATYPDARLKLVAGDVATVEEEVPMDKAMMVSRMVEAAPMEEGFQEEAFFEYHLYTLGQPTTVADRETKQVSLLSSSGVKARKLFIYDPNQARRWLWSHPSPESAVMVKVELTNSEEDGLGMSLPKGTVRLMKADQEGALQFIGEDSIDHTPTDEDIRLHVGVAFDLVGEYIHVDQQVRERGSRDTHRVLLRNHKAEPVTITYVAHLSGEWEILRSTHDYEKIDATTAEFTVTVPADDEVQIEYTSDMRW